MDSFPLTLLGLILQMLGICVGGFGLVGERFLNYKPLQTLITFLPKVLPLDLMRVPFFNSLFLTSELQEDREHRYNKGNTILVLFILLLPVTSILAVVYVLPVLLIFFHLHIPSGWIAFWVSFVAITHILTTIRVIRVTSTRDSQDTFKMRIKKFIMLQLRYWFYTPLVGIKMVLVLLLFIIMHCFAWISQKLPKRYAIDLSLKETRQRYYSFYSLSALLLGTGMLIFDLLL